MKNSHKETYNDQKYKEKFLICDNFFYGCSKCKLRPPHFKTLEQLTKHLRDIHGEGI